MTAGRYSRPSPLHRRGLQHSQTPLRARLSEPRAIRGSPRPATCQNRRLKLSTIKGALHAEIGAQRLVPVVPCDCVTILDSPTRARGAHTATSCDRHRVAGSPADWRAVLKPANL